MLSGNIQSRREVRAHTAKEEIHVSEVTLTRMIKMGERKSSDWLLITLRTGRDKMPVTGFSLKPTEAQPVFSPVNRVKLG